MNMAVTAIDPTTLKQRKNLVIGNPSAKLALAKDTAFIQSLVGCLSRAPLPQSEAQGSQDDVRIEAAHVISSISYGSDDALRSLLQASALHALLFALSTLKPYDPIALQTALLRALRTMSTAVAEVVGPSQLGLCSYSSDTRDEAKAVLDFLFELENLDVFLPLLDNKNVQLSTFVAQLIGATVRNKSHRSAVAEWLPFTDRIKEVKGKRGWEKPEAANSNAPSRLGGWVVRNLSTLLQYRNNNVQEAALSAIAALAMDNPNVTAALTKLTHDRESPTLLPTVLSLTTSRSTEVQLAACLCATHIIRANASNHPGTVDQAIASNIIHAINRVLSSSSERPPMRIRACYTLYYLVKDDKDICQAAVDHGALEKIASLTKSITPLTKDEERDEDEPESTAALREAALIVIAALSLFDNDIRREIADTLQLIPVIHISLSNRHVGVRYAACQCVRALSRAVAILRTNIMDSGLGSSLFQIFKKEEEDPRVTAAALAAITNMINDFSPLQPKLLAQGLMPRLKQLLDSGNSPTKVNVLWAIKNLLRKSTLETKQEVMTCLKWRQLANFCMDPDTGIQEQATAIFRNLAENDSGVDLIFQEMEKDLLFHALLTGLDSPDEDVKLQAAYFLANLANGQITHQDCIFTYPDILHSMHSCITDAKPEIRHPIMGCIYQMLSCNPKRRDDLNDFGIMATLRHMCDHTGGVSMSPGGRYPSHHIPMDDDKDTVLLARQILELDRVDH
ncbi:hypothetical protein SERLA73DRAFT_162574 [Serpula lacrymans var. lacrymans S7.3]|uniref:Uncharacterized protein n=2 Tax=Serpula lacrymans var. lacrymans TaxID=341189 RepID=F8Q8J5_SERL3|nr:uncharacterized protein SERLADRAFT_476541 [Serpula lacrymans var. lacrymans S7.9]EGN95883.1 hypothetical protein SERLA73DRAFT_162574 [Serpula lacrymans var. lacrymans S7.3]EGO21396.1 hypothetical protein SERLADRAFT_476541 [Serpula lacrymans var. lacrymans S7.9]